jgi:Domain of unknown function (DUF6946)
MSVILQPASELKPTHGAGDWQSGLADPEKQWRAGFSAMAAAQCWEDAQGLPVEIADLLGPEATLEVAVPEYKVPLPGGSRSSQCDVFALVTVQGQEVALAVEAKVNEVFGPLLGEWIADGSVGKQQRLSTICDLLDVPCPPPDSLRYQLFHRTAAAVLEARRFGRPVAAMIVQSFAPDDRWHGDFETFAEYIGCPAGVGSVGKKVLPDGLSLWVGWAKGDPRFLEHLGKA